MQSSYNKQEYFNKPIQNIAGILRVLWLIPVKTLDSPYTGHTCSSNNRILNEILISQS